MPLSFRRWRLISTPSVPHPRSRGNVRSGLRLYSRRRIRDDNFHFYRFVNKQLSQFIPWDKDNAFAWTSRAVLRTRIRTC